MITKVKKIVDGSSLKVKTNFKKFVNENHKILSSKDSKAINEKLNGFLSDNHIAHINFEKVATKNIINRQGEVYAVLEKYRQENNRLWIEAKKVFENVAKSGRYHCSKINEEFSVLEHKYSHLSRKINESSDLDLNTGTYSINSLQELKDNFDSNFVEKNKDKFEDVAYNDMLYNGGSIDLTISKDEDSLSGYTAWVELNSPDGVIDKDLQNQLNDLAVKYFESSIIEYVAESVNESSSDVDIYAQAKAHMQPEDIDHHKSDLYLKVNNISYNLVDRYQYPNNVKKFKSEIDGAWWYDIPFAWYKESVNESNSSLYIGTTKFKSFEELKDKYPNIDSDSLEEITVNSIAEFFDNGGYLEIEIEKNESSKSGLTASVEYTANSGYMIRSIDSNKLDALIKSNIENGTKSINEADDSYYNKIMVMFPALSTNVIDTVHDELTNKETKAGVLDRVSTIIAKELGYLDLDDSVIDMKGYQEVISKVFKFYQEIQPINESIELNDDEQSVINDFISLTKGDYSKKEAYEEIMNTYDKESLTPNVVKKLKEQIYYNEPINEDATEPEIITQLRKIVSEDQYDDLTDSATGKKTRIDMTTASLITQIFDAINDTQKVDYVAKGLIGMINIAYKIMNKSANESINEGAYDAVNESSEESAQKDMDEKSKELFGYGNGWKEAFGLSINKNYGDENFVKILTIGLEPEYSSNYFQVRVGGSKAPNMGEEADKFYADKDKLSEQKFNTVADAVAAADKFASDWNSKPINESGDSVSYVEATNLVKEKIKDWDGKGVLRFELVNPVSDEDKQLFLKTAGRDVQEKFGKPYQVTIDNKSVMITDLNNIDKKGNVINESSLVDDGSPKYLAKVQADYDELVQKFNKGEDVIKQLNDAETFLGLPLTKGKVNECVVGDSFKSQALSGINGTGTILKEEDGKYTIGFKSSTSKATDGYDKTITVDKDKLKNYIKMDSVNEANDNSLGNISRGTIENAENGNYIVRDTSKPIDDQIVYNGDDLVMAKGMLNVLNNPNAVNEDEDGYVTTKKDWEGILQKMQQYNRKDGFVSDKDNKLTFFDSKPSFSGMYVTLEMVEDIINTTNWEFINENKKYKPINESSIDYNEYTQKDDQFKYMMLSRLESDCKYYIDRGQSERQLYTGDKTTHIELMKVIWNSLTEKPEWLSMEQINDYAKQMGVGNKVNESDDSLDKVYKVQAMIFKGGYDLPQEILDQYLTNEDVESFWKGFLEVEDANLNIDTYEDEIQSFVDTQVQDIFPKNIILQYT